MKVRMHIRTAITNLLSTKMRSMLAALGILVGTAAVVAMVSGGELAEYQALRQFKDLGTNLMAVNLSSTTQSDSKNRAPIDLMKFFQTKTASSEIKAAAPYISIFKEIKFNGHKIDGSIMGANRDFANIMQLKVPRGRFISLLDKNAFYCVVGSDIYQKLKQYSVDPIGEQIQVGKHIFTIVGKTDPWIKNSFVYTNLDQTIFIPMRTALAIDKYANVNDIVMELSKSANIIKIQNAIRDYVGSNIPNQRLFFRSAAQILKSMTAQKQIFTTFLGFIGGVALLVGGIGIMNIMLVSVAERRQEIGIRLAVGAKRHDIQKMFLIESITLAIFGGLVGVLLGVFISFSVAEIKHWHFTLFLVPPIVGFCVSVTVGIFFGFYPAYKASKLDPIQALRMSE